MAKTRERSVRTYNLEIHTTWSTLLYSSFYVLALLMNCISDAVNKCKLQILNLLSNVVYDRRCMVPNVIRHLVHTKRAKYLWWF